MKKILIGLAAGAVALSASGAAQVSAAPPTVYEILTGSVGSDYAELLIDSAGLDGALDDCGNTGNNNGLPNYSVFFPAADAIFEAVLAELDLSLGQVLAQPALVKTVLLYHVVQQDITPQQLADNSNSKFMTMGGLQLIKTSQPTLGGNSYLVNGYGVIGVVGDADGYIVAEGGATQACNGWVYLIAGFLAPNSAITTIGLTADGSATQASGSGLPATGSESMALTYAALASLIAGAGVLVIRRRSVA